MNNQIPPEELSRIEVDSKKVLKQTWDAYNPLHPRSVYSNQLDCVKAGMTHEYLRSLEREKKAAKGLCRWVDAKERTPDKEGYYHTNIGFTEWNRSPGNDLEEMYWLNRQGGHVNKWLEESESPLPDTSQENMVEAINRAYHFGQMGYKIADVFNEFLSDPLPDTSQKGAKKKENAIFFATWAAEHGWELYPDCQENEDQLWYQRSYDINIPDEKVTSDQLYDLFLQSQQVKP